MRRITLATTLLAVALALPSLSLAATTKQKGAAPRAPHHTPAHPVHKRATHHMQVH